MITLDSSNVRLGAHAANKTEAIHQVGELLVNGHYVEPGYIESMMGREKVANTYLGNGIAIPHGLLDDRDLILNTGIAVLQVPTGVVWNPGETAYLIVGIAARSDEHIEVLANLTDVLEEEEMARRLGRTADPEEIISNLTRPREEEETPPEVPLDWPTYIDVTIHNPTGLHARPATEFVTVSKEFASEVRLRHGSKVANGKSLASVLTLGVESGGIIRVMAQGPDEMRALEALKAAVESGLGEEQEAPAPMRPLSPAYEWEAESAKLVVPGVPASPGLAIGPLRFLKRNKFVVEATARDPQVEQIRFNQAVEAARVQLKDLYQEVRGKSGASRAAIFLAHAEFLDDPELELDVSARINAGASAGRAWQQAIEQRVQALKKLDDPILAGRAVDLSDVGSRVLRFLAHEIEAGPALPKEPVILVAEDLTPSDTVALDPAFILGFATAGGGPTSHSAIIARALGIPAVVGAGPAILNLPEASSAILDGDKGNLYVEPSPSTVAAARKAQAAITELRERERLDRHQPALMTDGHCVQVVANIGKVTEAEQVVNSGGEGVGLMRTEFLFLERTSPPTEEEQFDAYCKMVRALNGLPLIIRTLDIGGDKNVPYLNLPAESNPFLGVRGIRLCLAQPELFRPQLRAIYRASRLGPVKIMFPMIATLEELEAAKEIAAEVRKEIGADPVDIGIMIEVPSAVMMAGEFAEQVDFFSIGTNDLTQYTLAMDRLHPMLARQADGLHPAVLRMVDRTVKAASSAGKWVGVCGGIAGDPTGAVILVGLGVAELSMSIPSIAAVKAQMRRLAFKDAQALAKQALACRTAAEVRALLLPQIA
jgi:phosphoenolpyruvate-protein phosphotransferase